MKKCQKMKVRQRARLGSIVRKHDSMTTSAGGETALERGRGGDNASWADWNLTGMKK
jgi:hypothetical protein